MSFPFFAHGSLNRLDGASTRWAIPATLAVLVAVGYLLPTLGRPTPNSVVWALLLGLATAAAARYFPRVRGRAATAALLAGLASGALLALTVPLARDQIPEVSVTATGQKNPNAKSSEVYVTLGPSSRKAFKGEHWERRGNIFVSYQAQPSVLRYVGSSNTRPVLQFVQHPYSGIAEVSINGATQRLDLYAEQEGQIRVPLPEATASWKSHVRRIALISSLSLVSAAIGVAMINASLAWTSVILLAFLAGSATLWLLKDRSYAGPMEIVAFDAPTAISRIQLDAGHGFTPRLVLPMASGTSLTADIPLDASAPWRLAADNGGLIPLRPLFNDPGPQSDAALRDCAAFQGAPCLYEVQAAASVWIENGDERRPLTLPAAAGGTGRRFLLVKAVPGGLRISASSAYLRLSAYEHFSDSIVAVRVIRQDSEAAGRLVALMSESGGYAFMAYDGAGAYLVPALSRPDTPSVIGMKILAALIAASAVLLLALGARITRVLASSFAHGRPIQVLLSVIGCMGWLGISLVAGWPAIMGWDGFSPYIQAQAGAISLWYGLGYPMIVGGFLMLGPPFLINIWSTVCTALLLLGTAALLLRHGSSRAGWMAPILLCVLLPCTAILAGTMTHLRDAMNGLTLAMFAVGAFYAGLRWHAWPALQRCVAAGVLMVCGAILALLRIDNIPALLAISTLMLASLYGVRLRAMAAALLVALLWLGINPIVERQVIPDRASAASEKRLYKSTALINPLTGMLASNRSTLPEPLRKDLRETLDKVLDVDHAIKHWSPSHIRYWHESMERRAVPTDETNRHLQKLYVQVVLADPLTFLEIRLATFMEMLGYAGFRYAPPQRAAIFHDHLLTQSEGWRRLSEILGFAPTGHPFPDAAKSLLSWQEKNIGTLVQLLVCIAVAFRFRRHPLASAIAAGEIARAGVFFLFAPASVFLYLYDLHILGLLLPLLALTEQSVRSHAVNWRTTR